MAEAKIKATPVNGVVQFIEQELTLEELEELKSRFSPEELRYFTGRVIASEEIPIDPVNRFTRGAAEIKGESVESFGRRAGRYGARLGMKTVYKFLMFVMSVETILQKAETIFGRVYDTGNFKVDAEEKSAVCHLTDFPSTEVGCARLSGWMEEIGEAAGAKNIAVQHVSCMAKGGGECRWELAWQ
ncbi:MAG: hypothetical protein R3338_12400 [Thermoanaerobaculia bacterium]|nr:hypothetical protein [Thermoanaerobaculia bacterium]